MPSGLGGTGKGNFVDVRVSRHPDAQIIAPTYGVDNTRWKSLLSKLNEFQITQGRVGRRLEDHRASCHKRRRNFPNGEQYGEIPGHNRPNNAHWGKSRYHTAVITIFNDLIGKPLGRHCPQPINRTKHFPFCSCFRLALLPGKQRYKFLSMGLN